jgi:predicted ATP-grasp superfamily ATP-dependent carboligase
MTDGGIAKLPPVLLADATWYGTLAAARDLGSRGVPVTLAADVPLAPARWSRFVSSVVPCPSTRNAEAFVEWLVRFGKQQPGHVLYPTSDDAAWLIAANRADLEGLYRLFSPPLEAYARLLDKGVLYELSRAAGLQVPDTWLPRDEADVERIAGDAKFPIMVKPRTMVLGGGTNKGSRVTQRENLVRAFCAARMPEAQQRMLGPMMQDAVNPMIQAYHATSERIYTLDAFIDRSGDIIALACYKLLQRPRRVGPGLVFEEAPLDDAVALGLQRVCKQAGFFGMIDVEFLVEGERRLLIDFNPRLYNHVAFEIDRGLPLPWLGYLGALGDEVALELALRAARRDARFVGNRAYVHRLPTEIMLTLQWLFGTISGDERKLWRGWLSQRAGGSTDPVSQPGDRMPAIADLAFHALEFARHPRSFFGHHAYIRGRKGEKSTGPAWAEPEPVAERGAAAERGEGSKSASAG